MLQKNMMPRTVWLWLQEQNRAFFIGEIRKQFGMTNKKTTKVMCALKSKGFVVTSRRRYIDVDGNLGLVYGLSHNLVKQRVIEYKECKRLNPTTHIRGRLSKPIVAVFKRLREINYKGNEDKADPIDHYDAGLTISEIKAYLDDDEITNRQISKVCALLKKRGVLYYSKFTLPRNNMSEGGDTGFVYSISEGGVWNGINRLMPSSVRESLNLLVGCGSVLSGFELRNRTGITTENQINWLRYRFADKMGLIRYEVKDGISYYYHSACTKEHVKRILDKYGELARGWRLDNTMRGYRFEERALWIYTMYKKTKGYDIKLPPGFPHVIPNWLNKEERDKYKIEYKDENGYKRVDWTCSIFKFNREPVDFILFLREKASREVHTYILTVKNDSARKFGVKYYTSFLGCIQSGRTFGGHSIPNYKSCRPVFVCSDTFGRDIYDYNSGFNDGMSGQLGSIITEHRLVEMCEEVNIQYPHEQEYQKAKELSRAFNLYQNHEDVLLGKKTLKEVMAEKGYDVKSLVFDGGDAK